MSDVAAGTGGEGPTPRQGRAASARGGLVSLYPPQDGHYHFAKGDEAGLESGDTRVDASWTSLEEPEAVERVPPGLHGTHHMVGAGLLPGRRAGGRPQPGVSPRLWGARISGAVAVFCCCGLPLINLHPAGHATVVCVQPEYVGEPEEGGFKEPGQDIASGGLHMAVCWPGCCTAIEPASRPHSFLPCNAPVPVAACSVAGTAGRHGGLWP